MISKRSGVTTVEEANGRIEELENVICALRNKIVDVAGAVKERIVDLEETVRSLKERNDFLSGKLPVEEYPYTDFFSLDIEREVEESVEILSNKVVKEHRVLKRFFKDKNKQYITVHYIGFIDPSDVEISTFSERRLDKARGWMTELEMSRVFYTIKQEDKSVAIASGYLPQLFRSYEAGEKPGKFRVTNGNHRIAVAIEKGIKHVLADITETVFQSRDGLEKN
jgi:hypothetical protein